MALKSFPKDYLLSSTPLQSPDDSGYFGSGQRRNNAVVLNSCSPIKESTHVNLPENIHFMHGLSPQIKLGQNLKFGSLTRDESLSSIEVNELSEFEFTSPTFSSQFELCKPAWSSDEGHSSELYSSTGCTASTSNSLNSLSADNDINYKLFHGSSDIPSSDNLKYHKCFENELCVIRNSQKCESKNAVIFSRRKVDFIDELLKRNCYSIISYILSFLSAKELCIASCVSKEWNKAILSDSKANARRQNLVTERLIFLNGPSKENRKGMKYGPAKEHKNVLSDLTNIQMSLDAVNAKVSNSKFESFVKESRNSKSKLLKCPRCFHAAKRMNEDRYMCTRCSYNFCSSCLDPYFTSHICFKPQIPNIVVGSKKSKRNLKDYSFTRKNFFIILKYFINKAPHKIQLHIIIENKIKKEIFKILIQNVI